MMTPPRRHPRRPVAVEPRDGYRIWLRYADGVEGEVDLSAVAGKGVFAAWLKPGFFNRVHVSEWQSIAWGDEIFVPTSSISTSPANLRMTSGPA